MPDGPGPYPTVVMLHGRFGNDEVMWLFRRTFPRPWLAVAPRAPLPDRDGFSWVLQAGDGWPSIQDFTGATAALLRFLDALPRLYNADPERTYLMGFSQGAAASFALAHAYPGRIRAIASLVGFAPGAPEGSLRGALAGLPVFMAIGTRDTLVPHAEALRSAEQLRLAQAELDVHEYDTGHKMTAEGLRDLQKWWLAR
jgi:phospholipase/carboxylesterase